MSQPSESTRPAITAVVLAAGKGTRMRSERAKVLHTCAGKPLVAHVIARAREAGAQRVVVVVGHEAAAVEREVRAHFSDGVEFALQREQLGTGHAVLEAHRQAVLGDGEVVVLCGDVPLVSAATLRAAVESRQSSGAALTVVGMRPASAHGYGRLVRDAEGRLLRIVEERDATPDERTIGEVNGGLYAIDGAFLARALPRLTPQNAQGEYYLTDLVTLAAADDRRCVVSMADAFEMAGINDRAQLADAELALRERINRHHMREGVTLRDPRSTCIDDGVEIAPDVELGPQVSLHGRTRLGRGVRIGQGCVLVDAVVADGVELKPYCHLEQAQVGAGSTIGPFARLRPGTELAEGVHIGNFVETKKTRMGRRSKANHLAYLGDAEIGEDCNIGAGTITCNYDGVNKHRTVLHDRVFIGSDSQLVAPVTLHDDAYVGAGTTVTRDVPAGALVVTRAPPVVKEGWTQRRRASLKQRG